MTSCRRAHDAILAKEKLLHAICSPNLDDELHDLWIVVSAIAANDEVAAICTFRNGEETAGDKGLGVVWLLENLDLLAQPRPATLLSILAVVLKGAGGGKLTFRASGR